MLKQILSPCKYKLFHDGDIKQDKSMAAVDYNYEINRLESFNNWTKRYIDKNILALLGFYYYGPDDMVKCHFCNVEICMWEDGDDVLNDHIKWSPTCNFIRRNITNNRPIDAARLDVILPPAPTPDVCGFETVSEGTINSINHHRGVVFRPEFAIAVQRLQTFEDWPKSMHQTPSELSDAGFFYLQRGDKVKCFSCGIGIKDWVQTDIPWEQHAMWSPDCEYLKLLKGEDFISDIIGKGKKLPTMDKEAAEIEKQEDEVEKPESSGVCKICCINEFDTIFLPCGHIIACAQCASSVTKCPVCRQQFKEIKKIYFS
jgi:hypothetical protein